MFVRSRLLDCFLLVGIHCMFFIQNCSGASILKNITKFAVDENATVINGNLSSGAEKSDYQYVIVIDGGSSHTDIYVYKWPSKKVNGTGVVTQEEKLVCQPVLSNFKDHPENAGPSLGTCLDFATQHVPQSQRKSTKILLGATAGMRVLHAHNESIAAAIFNSVVSYISKNYDFIADSKHIGILPADKEGGFAWLSINYVKGILSQNAYLDEASRKPTWGSLDVGGASTQFSVEITDISKHLIPTFMVTVYGHTYRVFTRSFLCYGKQEAFRRYKALIVKSHNFNEPIVAPCLPKGAKSTVKYVEHFENPCSNSTASASNHKIEYAVVGGGDGQKCLDSVRQLFQQTMDLNPSLCPFQDKDCTFDKIKKGRVRGKFLGTGALYYDTKNLRDLSDKPFNISRFDPAGFRAARNTVCQKTSAEVEQLIAARPEVKSFALRQCFDATYAEVLLHDVYKLSDDILEDMVFAKNIDGLDIGWTLGWALISSLDREESYANVHENNGIIIQQNWMLMNLGREIDAVSVQLDTGWSNSPPLNEEEFANNFLTKQLTQITIDDFSDFLPVNVFRHFDLADQGPLCTVFGRWNAVLMSLSITRHVAMDFRDQWLIRVLPNSDYIGLNLIGGFNFCDLMVHLSPPAPGTEWNESTHRALFCAVEENHPTTVEQMTELLVQINSRLPNGKVKRKLEEVVCRMEEKFAHFASVLDWNTIDLCPLEQLTSKEFDV